MEEDKGKKILAAIAGLFDPWLREGAQKIAAQVPEDSILRNKKFESALGALKGYLEAWAERLPTPAAVAVEKATDVSDFLAGAIKDPAAAGKNWIQEFVTDAFLRLKDAADPEAELEKIKREFEIKQTLLNFIKEKQKGPPSEAVTRITEGLEDLNQRLRAILEKPQAKKGGGS